MAESLGEELLIIKLVPKFAKSLTEITWFTLHVGL